MHIININQVGIQILLQQQLIMNIDVILIKNVDGMNLKISHSVS